MSRWHFLKFTLAAAMLSGLMLSPRLWLSERSYPLVPVWDGLPAGPAPWDWLVLSVLVAALAAVVAAPRPRLVMLVFVILAGVWSLWDQTRWQPWFYQYLVMFAVLALSPAPEDPERGQASLNACRVIVAGIYFWSGLQKINVVFAAEVFPWLMEPLLKQLPGECHEYLRGRGWEAAYLECAIGVGLLVRPLRQIAVVGALVMHLFVLFILGPWGHGWNTVVWPWNAAMMVFVVVLFGRTRQVQPWHILWPRGCLAARAALVLFGVMPLFNFFERWDSSLSAALYSGNTPATHVYVSQEVFDRLPPEVTTAYATLRADAALDDPCPYEVDTFSWAMGELKVPDYRAERVSRGVCRRLAQLPDKPPATGLENIPPRDGRPGAQVILILQGRADWQTGARQEKRVVFPE